MDSFMNAQKKYINSGYCFLPSTCSYRIGPVTGPRRDINSIWYEVSIIAIYGIILK